MSFMSCSFLQLLVTKLTDASVSQEPEIVLAAQPTTNYIILAAFTIFFHMTCTFGVPFLKGKGVRIFA